MPGNRTGTLHAVYVGGGSQHSWQQHLTRPENSARWATKPCTTRDIERMNWRISSAVSSWAILALGLRLLFNLFISWWRSTKPMLVIWCIFSRNKCISICKKIHSKVSILWLWPHLFREKTFHEHHSALEVLIGMQCIKQLRAIDPWSLLEGWLVLRWFQQLRKWSCKNFEEMLSE